MSRFNKREGRKRSSNDDDEEVCVVCFREVEIYSIGECDHPVCHECSTRMRVLCGRTECPICRKDMAMVVFTRTVQPFLSLHYRNLKCERRYSIYFQDDFIMKAYDSLLEHSCLECEGRVKFRNFNLLKDHMRKIHENFYCELCVENLKIFTHERRSYNRTLLAHHRRVGDTDDKSHRGHPLCEFCDSRFMDNDDLFRHLRRDHYFCHFCDADGQHQYYEDYEALRKHFQHDHFLCEEGDCMEERFTSAFRTKLDLQAHATQHHSHMMSKSEARQARTVDIAFTVNHRPAPFAERGRGGRRGEAGRGRRGGEGRMQQDVDEQIAAAMATPPSQMLTKQQAIDINCKQDFPSLNGLGGQAGEGGAGNKSIAHRLAQQNRFTIRATKGQALTEEEFPSLGSAKAGTNASAPPTTSLHLSVNTKKNMSTNHQGHSNVSIEYNCTKPNATLSDSITTFAGRGRGKPRIGAVSHSGNITVKSSSGAGARPKSAALEEDFPSLQPASKPFLSPFQATTTTASWTPNQVNTATVVASKPPKKVVNNADAKAANAKKLPVFESSSDFPSLAPSLENLEQKLNYSGRSSLKIPMKKVNNAHMADKNLENEENAAGGRGKKKKKGAPPPTKGSSFEFNKNSQNATTASTKPSKKKPFVLSNIYDDLDPNEPVEDYSKTRQGEYEAVAPVLSSNINFISADTHSGKDTKKSELQIGTLKAPDISSDDFPSLGGRPNRGQKKSGKGPPSFEGKGNSKDRSSWNPSSQQSKKRPSIPPGFSKKSGHPGIPSGFANTDMTFTSSLGQKFAISPTSEKPEAAPPPPKPQKKKGAKPPGFIFPPNFDQRNKLLIDAINFACEGNPDTFKKFKQLAEVFRSGRMKGYEYYAKCRQVMGKEVFHQILPELLALLPDISKQQAVLEAYRTVDDGQGCEAFFAVCAVCQQVLVSEDFPSHMASHEFPADEFPSLKPPSAPFQRRK